jgi:diguanylate cyclase (GGDEF)-like protein
VANQDTTDLKRETMAAVSAMEALTHSRRERQREQFSMLADKLKDLGRELEDARRESALDALTGLPNRRTFDAYVTRSIELHSLMGRPASLLIIDVDNFKVINDTFGHSVGDDALRQVTRSLSRTILRKVDFVCRMGGDEFAVILQETDGTDAVALGDKLRRSLGDVLAAQRDCEPVLDYTISVGVAELKLGDDAIAWVNRADRALYEAKRLGRDQIVIQAECSKPTLVAERTTGASSASQIARSA